MFGCVLVMWPNDHKQQLAVFGRVLVVWPYEHKQQLAVFGCLLVIWPHEHEQQLAVFGCVLVFSSFFNVGFKFSVVCCDSVWVYLQPGVAVPRGEWERSLYHEQLSYRMSAGEQCGYRGLFSFHRSEFLRWNSTIMFYLRFSCGRIFFWADVQC